jgi:predicted ester cyclase
VVVENIVSGTFKNDFLGNKATNNSFKQREAVFFDVENGKIKMQRIYMDQKALEKQQGILK